MIRLTLSPEEQAHLEQTRRTRLHLAERCHYVLLNAQGWSVPQIAQRLNRNEHPIRTWPKAYRTAGLPGLTTRGSRGRCWWRQQPGCSGLWTWPAARRRSHSNCGPR